MSSPVTMAVNPDRANEILADFHQRVDGIVRKNGLDHHGKSNALASVDAMKNYYVNTVMTTLTLPVTSEGELLSEMNVALVQIERLTKQIATQEATQIAAIGSAVNKSVPADSRMWNNVIMDTASRIEKISTMFADQINNMPKSLRARIDSDFAGVLDAINDNFNRDPSPGNANIVAAQVKNSLDAIEKDLSAAATAVMKASIESLVQQKMTEVQEKELSLQSTEAGMTKPQIDGYRRIVKEVRKMILELGNSNYLVYDKVIRNQKLANIDSKISILETLRVNSSGVAQSLSGYFGNTSKRPNRRTPALNGVGSTIGMNTAIIGAAAKNFRKGIPPGFAGFAGKMTKENIANQHPPGTSKSHIDAMFHYMSKGMSFEEAHNKANREGFTPASHDKNFGGGPNPFV